MRNVLRIAIVTVVVTWLASSPSWSWIEPGDHRRHVVDRRCDLRREGEHPGARPKHIEAALKLVNEGGDGWDERDGDEDQGRDEDRADDGPGAKRGTDPRPATCPERDDERCRRGCDHRREHDRGRLGDENERDPRENHGEPADDEETPTEGLEVREPRRNEPRSAIRRARRVTRRHRTPSVPHARPVYRFPTTTMISPGDRGVGRPSISAWRLPWPSCRLGFDRRPSSSRSTSAPGAPGSGSTAEGSAGTTRRRPRRRPR